MRDMRTITLTLWLAGAFAMPGAQAGITVTTLDPFSDGVLPDIATGALRQPWWEITTGSGVASEARHVETRVSQLYNPAMGKLEYLDLLADSGWNSTHQIGQQAVAFASIEQHVQLPDFVSPAAAKTSLFGNHARAHTGDRYRMWNDVDVTLGGTTYEPFEIHQTGGNRADARSAWYDTWQATDTALYPLTVRLDGSFGQFTCQDLCFVSTPGGITAYERLSRQRSFKASFTVLDLDTLVDCDDPDACGFTGLRPKAVAQLKANYQRNSDDEFPLLHDTTHTLDFATTAGHRYLVIGLMEASSSDGGEISFDNSFRLTGVGAPVGALSSAALGGDLATGWQQPVPEPGTALLLVGGLTGLVALRRRARTA